ncbi:MAG: signal protein PDZ, partial [Armatimonadetes bacterium]|nr:signal protein PDZ [Armatimonadota bacterium]
MNTMAMLTSVSDELTALADAAGPAVVRVEARHRRPGSGVVWANDLVVTADHVVE